MKKKLLVFPFDYTNYVLATENECISKYDVTAFVCTKNSPFCNEDAGIFVNKKTGIIVSDQYERQLGLVDSVLFTSGLEDEFIDIYIEKIDIAKKMQKEILVTKDILEQLEKKQISSQGIICLEEEVDFDLHCSEDIYDIDVPIITVTGAGENCEKFDLQLTVRKIFTEKNYKVFQIGTKEYSTLFELDNWPKFLFSQEISFPKKVLAFNRWIFEKVKKLKPDIIILGIPGGIMPINNKICNYFGELALITSKALKIDVNILSLYFNKNINHELLKSYQDYCQFALNFPTNYFNISSNYFKYDEEKNEYKIEIFHMDSEYVKKEFPENNLAEFYVFNSSYKIGALLSSDNILKEFIDNIEVV